MKKFGIIAVAMALLVGLSQCKKENLTTPEQVGEKVHITLNVGGSNNNRVNVNTACGEVAFEENDVIYVASNGVYVGTLAYNGTQFSGNVTDPVEGQKLHFYFLGNVDLTESLAEGTSTECSVVISDQRTKLPVISYAPSREDYETGRTAYNATLLNKCALVKLNVTTISEAATCITGMNNKVTVDFATNGFTYSQEGAGSIVLPAGNGERWAILLPQDEVTDAVVNSYDGIHSGTCGTVPAIAANDYLTEGITATIDHRAGVINGLFSVSATQQVRFSKGNLQYIGSAGNGEDNNTGAYWKFADYQWDCIGETTPQATDSKTIDRDLFGWGTSGFYRSSVLPEQQPYYQPWSISATNSKYRAFGTQSDLYAEADWGYNAIRNGGNAENSGWRTPSRGDWYYLFNTRSTASDIRWVVGSVNDVNGYILLPDDWSAATYALNYPNDNSNGFGSNTISAEDWTNSLEAYGAVFLPAAGKRVAVDYFESPSEMESIYINDVGSYGYYWSSEYYEASKAFKMYLASTNYSTNWEFRSYGLSVRLVRDAE